MADRGTGFVSCEPGSVEPSMMADLWKIVGTEDYFLELEDPEGWWKAGIKWDGCVNLWQYNNLSLDEDRERKSQQCLDHYIHICDIDDAIKRLEAIKAAAVKHFGEDWPE